MSIRVERRSKWNGHTSIRDYDIEPACRLLNRGNSSSVVFDAPRGELDNIKRLGVLLREFVELRRLGGVASTGEDDRVGSHDEGFGESESNASVGAGDCRNV